MRKQFSFEYQNQSNPHKDTDNPVNQSKLEVTATCTSLAQSAGKRSSTSESELVLVFSRDWMKKRREFFSQSFSVFDAKLLFDTQMKTMSEFICSFVLFFFPFINMTGL